MEPHERVAGRLTPKGKKMVDVTVRATIPAAGAKIAAVMFDPSRDPKWIGGTQSVEVIGPLPYGIGTRVRRHGAFLCRSFACVTEITEFEAGRLVRMKHVAGPFTGGVDYSITPAGEASEVVIRNYGNASFWFPFMVTMKRASVQADLQRLGRLLA